MDHATAGSTVEKRLCFLPLRLDGIHVTGLDGLVELAKRITQARAAGTIAYPARFVLAHTLLC